MKKLSKEELELMSYTDIAYEIIKEEKKSKTTMEIFKEIGKLLELSDSAIDSLIADFFTSMTTDKRFLLLEEGTWDLRDRHVSSKVKKGAELEDDEEEESEEEEDIEEVETEDEYDALDETNEDDDFEDDSLDDLVVVDEKELGMDE